MKQLILFSCTLMTTFLSFGQSKFDHKIIVAMPDSIGLYDKVRYNFADMDFIVKDNGRKDTLTTLPRSVENIQGYVMAKAVIKGNTVTLNGVYGLTRVAGWGYTLTPKYYNNIGYYKGSRTWKLLMRVAERLGGTITYGQ